MCLRFRRNDNIFVVPTPSFTAVSLGSGVLLILFYAAHCLFNEFRTILVRYAVSLLLFPLFRPFRL